MIAGTILLGLAALVVVVGAVCWLAGVQLMALVKVFLGVSAVLLTLAGGAVVTTELVTSAGNYHSAQVEPPKTVPTTQPAYPTNDMDQDLHWMHEHTVGVFIEGEGFGMYRSLQSDYADITAPNSLSENSDVAWGIHVREKGNGKVHHAGPDMVPGRWMGILRTRDGLEVRKIYLVGLVKHPEPVVYLTDQVPNMKDAKDVPMRNLDAFEKAALETLRGGKNFAVEKNGGTVRVLGPIYAGKGCVKCHDQKGQLLGAFTYQLERVPVAKSENNK
jgi:hypothetical protein